MQKNFCEEIEQLNGMLSSAQQWSLKREAEANKRVQELFKVILEKDVTIQELSDKNEHLETKITSHSNFIPKDEFNRVYTEAMAMKSNLRILERDYDKLKRENKELLTKRRWWVL